MRLLNTYSLKFEEFFDSNIPHYGILSHRWEKDEVSFETMSAWSRRLPKPTNDEPLDPASLTDEDGVFGTGAGFRKVIDFCKLCQSNGLKWGWVDTCCIDKRSSAELSEAINSMYRWYGGAKICFAYLSDVDFSTHDGTRPDPQTPGTDDPHWLAFRRSKWFTRGWTLQELLAPLVVQFYDHNWRSIGDRGKLRLDIHMATGISEDILFYPRYKIAAASVAQKMSWLSSRQTSRGEDIAYCMFGLFDINLPLLYGEGRAKAFHRLQLEIIRTCDDESIFAWRATYDLDSTRLPPCSPLLAQHPAYFATSAQIHRKRQAVALRAAFTVSSKGMDVSVPNCRGREVAIDFVKLRDENELSLYHVKRFSGKHTYFYVLLALGCYGPSLPSKPITIVLEKHRDGTFERVHDIKAMNFIPPLPEISFSELFEELKNDCITVRVRNTSAWYDMLQPPSPDQPDPEW